MGYFYFRNYPKDVMAKGVNKEFMRTLAHSILPHVYVLSAWEEHDGKFGKVTNMGRSIDVAEHLYSSGNCIPVVPDLTIAWNQVYPRSPEFWLEYRVQLMSRCDVALCVGSDADLAEKELSEASRIGLPVFYTGEDLQNWITTAKENNE